MFRKLFFDKFMKIELRRVLKTNERLFGSTAFVCCDKKSGEGAPKIGSSTFTKYEPFKDDRSPVILDVEEERRRIAEMPAGYEEDVEEKEVYEPFAGISPERKLNYFQQVDIARYLFLRKQALKSNCLPKNSIPY